MRHSPVGFLGPFQAPYSPTKRHARDHRRPEVGDSSPPLGVMSSESLKRAEMSPHEGAAQSSGDDGRAVGDDRFAHRLLSRGHVPRFRSAPIRVPAFERRSPQEIKLRAAGRGHEVGLVSEARRALSYRVYAARQPIMCPPSRCAARALQSGDQVSRHQSANLFDLIAARAPRSGQARSGDPGRHRADLWRVVQALGAGGQCAGRARGQARRPGRGADREINRHDRCHPRLPSGGRGAAAAEHRLYACRARIFPWRRRTCADPLSSRPARGGSCARAGTQLACGRKSRRQGRRNIRRSDRRRADGIRNNAARER